ncbi:hypothetical protein LR48_Vigan07g002200 [Vigna angularis]|uniref:NB-ARC domain-containing protein n=2 Tax=Phaseolus angularis TaxID=3914 RepID=A0A0L9UU85_PHAAN|nr:hypothetical protein LR48_Vigan07g002200 [Vigna angularis]
MEALKDDGVAMIGLYGMGGCGKTTLAMEVKKIADAEHLFDKVIFAPVSSTVEVSTIQDKIASSLQYKFPEDKQMERSQRLCMILMQEKKILIIVDDVWEKLDFGRIGIPSSEYHKGCKILITTRSEDVCISMNCQKNIYLPILTDEEAWTLFQNKALISKDTPENIKHLGISISNECKGLPVAIVAVASSLKGKQEAIWRYALNKLKSSKPINIAKGLRDPYKCLQLSYDNLDTEEARSLFLLCSVFPEDYEITLECLIRCAIGLGVAGEVETYEAARAEVTEAKIKLVSSCLLLEADDECVKMHDLVRDVAHWIAKNENKIIKCEVEKDVSLEQGYLTQLKTLSIEECDMLEQIIESANHKETNEIVEEDEQHFESNQVKVSPTSISIPSVSTVNNSSAWENYRIPDWRIWSLVEDIKKLDKVSRSNNSTELPSLQINEKSDKNVTEKDYRSEEVAPATSINAEDLDPTPKNTSPLQMNREDPSISQIKPFSSQVNDNNQSMLESKVEMVGQHNKIETKTQESEIEEFQKIDRKSEMTSDPEAMEQNFPDISSPNMNERTDEIETDNLGKTTTSDKPAIPTSVSENIEEIGRERSRGGAATEGATIKTLPIGGDNISLVSGVTIHNSSGANILIQDSQVVKQDSEMNEDKTEIAPYKNIKIQEGLNLLDKTEGIGIVSNNDVVVTPDTRTRLEKYKHLVDLNDSQICLLVEAIEAYPHLWNACEKFTDRFRAWMLKTLADMLLFLRSESVGSINREREREFLKLCDEAVQLGFERSWVDEMRQRVLGRDPKLDHAKVRINELLKRHDHLTWELDNIKK